MVVKNGDLSYCSLLELVWPIFSDVSHQRAVEICRTLTEALDSHLVELPLLLTGAFTIKFVHKFLVEMFLLWWDAPLKDYMSFICLWYEHHWKLEYLSLIACLSYIVALKFWGQWKSYSKCTQWGNLLYKFHWTKNFKATRINKFFKLVLVITNLFYFYFFLQYLHAITQPLMQLWDDY